MAGTSNIRVGSVYLPWCGYQYMIATGNGSYGSTSRLRLLVPAQLCLLVKFNCDPLVYQYVPPFDLWVPGNLYLFRCCLLVYRKALKVAYQYTSKC
ncbi:hypothetical protein FOFC_19805 [Fusarium oxysporum]|nr:hypothetical protein FOFC_19805 [Fusarium oxysporum]